MYSNQWHVIKIALNVSLMVKTHCMLCIYSKMTLYSIYSKMTLYSIYSKMTIFIFQRVTEPTNPEVILYHIGGLWLWCETMHIYRDSRWVGVYNQFSRNRWNALRHKQTTKCTQPYWKYVYYYLYITFLKFWYILNIWSMSFYETMV